MALSVAVFVGESQQWIPDLIQRCVIHIRYLNFTECALIYPFRAQKLRPGPGEDPASDIGPVVTKESYERILRIIADGTLPSPILRLYSYTYVLFTIAEKQGAKVILDGRHVAKPKGFEGGNYMGATIIDNCDLKNPVCHITVYYVLI